MKFLPAIPIAIVVGFTVPFVAFGSAASTQEKYTGEISYARATIPFDVTIEADVVRLSAIVSEKPFEVGVYDQRSVSVSWGLEGAGWGGNPTGFQKIVNGNPDLLVNGWSERSTFPLWPDLPIGLAPAIFDELRKDPRVRRANEALLVGLSRIEKVQNGLKGKDQEQKIPENDGGTNDRTRGNDATPFGGGDDARRRVECTEESEEDWGASVLNGSLAIPGIPISLDGKIGYSKGKSECFDPPPPACEAAVAGGVSGSLSTENGDDSDCEGSGWDYVKITSGKITNHHSQDAAGCKAAEEDELAMLAIDVMMNGASLAKMRAGEVDGNMASHSRVGGSVRIVTCYEDDVWGTDPTDTSFTSTGVYACFNKEKCDGEPDGN